MTLTSALSATWPLPWMEREIKLLKEVEATNQQASPYNQGVREQARAQRMRVEDVVRRMKEQR